MGWLDLKSLTETAKRMMEEKRMGADGRPKKVENEVLERKIRLLEAELDLYKLKYDEALHALGEENPQAARDINEWA